MATTRTPLIRLFVRLLVRLIVRVAAGALLAGIVVGLPAALVTFVGWPLPRALPDTADLTGWLTGPISDTVILNALAVAAWLLWAAFLPAVLAEAHAAHRGLPTPATTGQTHNPVRLGAAALITALTLGALPGTTTASPAVLSPHDTTSTAPAASAGFAAVPAAVAVTDLNAGPVAHTSHARPAGPAQRGPATVHVGARRYTYVVERGDTLSGISAAWLGDAHRWPEICRLNWHRHWPTTGGRLTDCDLIYPGWDLRLPDDATPPAAARPERGSPRTSGDADEPATPAPTTPSPDAPATAAPAPPAPPTVTASPAAPTPTAPTASAASQTAAGPTATDPIDQVPADQDPVDQDPVDQDPVDQDPAAPAFARDGITLPGGFLPWPLAAALAAAVALVWLHRRRRHTPGAPGDDPTDLPASLLHVTHEVARNPALPTAADPAERAADVPDQLLPPPGGLAVVGDGAHAAARAMLVAVLASGGPRDPDHQGEAVIDGATLTTLIGADAAALGPWPRLHVADDLEHALALLETRLLHRARLLDEHHLTDLDTLRHHAPDEEPLPAVVLITEPPPPGARMRLKTTLAVGADTGITALILGDWPHTPTVHVDPDGHTHTPDQHSDDVPGEASDQVHDAAPDGLPEGLDGVVPERVAVLDAQTAVEALTTLREAHTGHRPAPTTPPETPSPTDIPPPTGGPSPPSTPTAPTVSAAPAAPVEPPGQPSQPNQPGQPGGLVRKARLRVLGTPRVDEVTAPGQPLRAKAAEVAVFLACHRDGATTHTIGDHLEPGIRRRSADVRVHTNVSNLRHVLGRAAGPRRNGYVTKPDGRYRLDPTTVDVDLWTFHDLLTRAETDTPSGNHTGTGIGADERVRLLRQACDLYTAPLADGCDYDWIEPHREHARQQATTAHTLLAGALHDTDPQAAADVLDRAITLDPYNENLYRQAMHARAATGDTTSIRALLHALTIALADLDTEPDAETVRLAQRLRDRAGLLPGPTRPRRQSRD